MRNYKKFLGLILAGLILLSLSACSKINIFKSKEAQKDGNSASYPIRRKEKTVMVTDIGGLNDKGINQLSWQGLKNYEEKTGNKIEYIESRSVDDYKDDLKYALKKEAGLVWGIGYSLGGLTENAAKQNLNQNFANIDWIYGTDKDGDTYQIPKNLTGVLFKSQEPSFLVGYIAGLTTKTNKLAFIGGLKGFIIDQYEYGFRAGVREAGRDLKREIHLDVQYIDSFDDVDKARDLAHKMYAGGADIIFSCAGRSNLGVLEAARDEGKYLIGQDVDIAYLSPQNVLTSALKRVDLAIEDLTTRYAMGEEIGGRNYLYGLKEGAGGIPDLPEEGGLVSKDVYDRCLDKEKDIISGKILVPFSEETWKEFNK